MRLANWLSGGTCHDFPVAVIGRYTPLTTESVENYLKAIYKLQSGEEWVSTSDIASRLGVSAQSVSRMMKRLCEANWVHHTPYKGVRLTDAGRRHALRVVRNHRILAYRYIYTYYPVGY